MCALFWIGSMTWKWNLSLHSKVKLGTKPIFNVGFLETKSGSPKRRKIQGRKEPVLRIWANHRPNFPLEFDLVPFRNGDKGTRRTRVHCVSEVTFRLRLERFVPYLFGEYTRKGTNQDLHPHETRKFIFVSPFWYHAHSSNSAPRPMSNSQFRLDKSWGNIYHETRNAGSRVECRC